MSKNLKLAMSEAIKLLQASGATLKQKSGAFLMPLSSQLSDAIELDRLKKAYLNTTYRIQEPAIDIRIGGQNHALGEFLSQIGHTNWSFITAWNPYSKPLSIEENISRNQNLLHDIRQFHHFIGEGIGDDPSWGPEASYLIVGIQREVSIFLGKKYEQNAIVVGSLCDAELVILN